MNRLCFSALTIFLGLTELEAKSVNVISAVVSLTYQQPNSDRIFAQLVEGRYAASSKIEPELGRVVHILTEEGTNDGCTRSVNTPMTNLPSQKGWIALIQRGGCPFSHKMMNAVYRHNASAVVIYNHIEEDVLITMDHYVDGVVSVFISKEDGEHIAALVDGGVGVYMNITVGSITMYEIVPKLEEGESRERSLSSASSEGGRRGGSKTVLAIAVTVIVVMALGLISLLVVGVLKANRRRMHAAHSAHIVYNRATEGKQAKEILLESGDTTSTEVSTDQ